MDRRLRPISTFRRTWGNVQYYRTIERSFAVAGQSALSIANRSGELTVIGEDREDIAIAIQLAVSADSEREGRQQLDAMEVPMQESGGHVQVGPPSAEAAGKGMSGTVTIFGIRVGIGAPDTRLDMVARVPRRCLTSAEHRSGPLRITGIHADVTAQSQAGRCEIAEIDGSLRLDSRSGTVEVRAVTGDVSIDSRSGRVEVEDIGGHAQVRSRSGSVSVRDVEGAARIESRSGRVQVEDVRGPVAARAHSGAFEYRGRIAQPMDIDVYSGAVRLAVTRDSAFYMDAETHVGSIRSELPVDYLSRPPEDAPTVRVRTHAGAIRIVTA
jgi:hypothetical protein